MRSMTQKKKIKSEDVQKPPGHSLAASSWLLSCVEYHQRDHLRTNCPGGRREKNLFHSLPSIKASFTEPQSFQAESLGSLGSSPGSQWPQGSLMTVQAQWSSLPCNGLQRQWWPGSISVEIVWGPAWPEPGNYTGGVQEGRGYMNCVQHSSRSESMGPSVNVDLVFGQVLSGLHVLYL